MMVEDYEENYITGFVTVYRSIRNHWIFDNEKYLKWWLIMLFEVNHKEKEIVRYYEVYKIKRGQSCNSLRTWANLFNSTPKTVRKFFDLLEKDKMISLHKIGKGKQALTLVNIENYCKYQLESKQGLPQGVNKKETRSKQGLPTNNNDNNGNNGNNDNNIPQFSEFLDYAKTKKPNVDAEDLKNKYSAWIYNDWKDGNGKKIKSWKLKLNNTLPYIKENYAKNKEYRMVNGEKIYNVI